jgi:hypothetical protein
MRILKNTSYIIAAFILFSFKSGNTCESYFPQKIGTKWELTNYNEKDKVVSKSRSELVSVNDIKGGLEATINIETFDDKDKSMSKGSVTMKCTDDKFYMDMGNMFPKDQMAGMEGAEIEMTNEFMEFPSNPTVGQVLPDAESTMTMKMNGMNMMTMTIKMTNRKIEGYEDVTTPAGTFHCVKYSSDSEVKSMMFKTKSHSIMYMAKNVGNVKMESFDDKGKLQSKMLLTAFSE